jgi:ABC-2 type transport system ATP-binding protein
MIKVEHLCVGQSFSDISDLSVDVGEGQVYVLLSSGDIVNNHLGNIFLGLERAFKGMVAVDGADILPSLRGGQKSFIFIDNRRDWPHSLKTADVIAFFQKEVKIPEEELEELFLRLDMGNIRRKKIHELAEVEWRKLIFGLAGLRKCKNYVIRDFAKGMPLDFVLDFKRNLFDMRNNGCAVLYLSNDVFFAREIANRVGFMKKGKLLLELTGARLKKMDLNDLYFKFLAED